MAKLEIELIGNNVDLKKVLRESRKELNDFSKLFNQKPSNAVNNSLQKTLKLLKEIKATSSSINLGGIGGASGNNSQQINEEALALARARTEAQSYRTESARLAAELQRLRLANAQNRQQTTAASGSYREAQQTLTALGRSIREAAGGFNSMNPAVQAQIRQYRELNSQLTAFDRQMGNNYRNVGNYGSALNGLASNLQGVISGYLSFSALIAIGGKIIKSNAEISDSLADVRRTAGLTADEADNLAVSLKSLDTRSSLKDLLAIATIGGQLGISNRQLAGFTKAIDELSVALGSELKGGAEGIAKSLGVLDNVFRVTESNAGDVNKAYNQIGSAILGLGQSGLATGDFLADFGERVGGLAKQAGISLPVILSYGAVLQEAGVSAEVAGSAFKRLISALSSNSKRFFDIAKLGDANLTLKEFNRLVNTDTQKALEVFFKGLQKGGSSTIAFNTILKDLKLSGAGVSQVVSALSQGQESLNGHIRDATKDFNDATLASDQFRIKNDNLAASLDKLTNAFTNLTTNPNSDVAKFFKNISDAITDFINDIGDAESRLRKFIGYTPTGLIYKGANAIFNSGSVGGYINGTPVSKSEYEKYQKSLKADKDRVNAVVATKTTKLVNESKTEADLLRKIANEEARLAGIRAKEKEQNKELSRRKDIIKELGEGQKFYTSAKDAERKTADKNYKQAEEQLRGTKKNIDEQKQLVDSLRSAYDSLYKQKTKTERSNASAPTGFGKKTKTTSSGDIDSFDSRIEAIATRSQNDIDVLGLKSLEKANEETKQKYAKLSTDLDNIQKQYTEKYKKELEKRNQLDKKTADTKRLIETNLALELDQNAKDFAQKQADIISSIQEKAGIVREASRIKDLQANEAYYNEQIRKYAGFASIISALETARLQERANINKKYDDELNANADAVFQKIIDIQNKAFTENVKGNARGRQIIQQQLKDRLDDLRKYFDELRKLYANNPFVLTGLNVAKAGLAKDISKGAQNASSPINTRSSEAIRGVIEGFGRDFANTLTDISGQADKTFKGIFSNLVDNLSKSLNDVLVGQFTKSLSDALQEAGDSLAGGNGGGVRLGKNIGLALGLGVGGSIISGLTNKSSYVGQGLGGAISGAGAGLAIGTALGGPGIGTAIGGLVGLLGGLFGAGKARKQEELQRRQLEEQKKQTKLLERANALAYAASIIGRQTVNGVVTGVEVNEFGQLSTKISGRDLEIVLDRANRSRKRGT